MTKEQIYSEWLSKVRKEDLKKYLDPFTETQDPKLEVNWYHRIAIGGSSVSALLGVSKWLTAQDVYDVMTGAVDNSTLDDNFVFMRGHALEQLVADGFTAMTRIRTTKGITIFDEKHNRLWSEAQIDRMTEDGTPVEIKTSLANPLQKDGRRAFGRGCDFTKDGKLLTEDDTIPVDYYIQCQKQMYATDKKVMWLCVWLTFETNVRVFRIKRDDEMIKKIIKAEDDFMFNHVIPCKPLIAETEKALDDAEENAVYANAEVLDKIKKLKEIKESLENLKKEEDNITTELKQRMGDARSLVTLTGELLATKTVTRPKNFNKTKFKNEHPKMYLKYQENGKVVETFRLSSSRG